MQDVNSIKEELLKMKFFYETEGENGDLENFLIRFNELHKNITEKIVITQNSLLQMKNDVSLMEHKLDAKQEFPNAISLNMGLMVGLKKIGELMVLLGDLQVMLTKMLTEHTMNQDQIDAIKVLLSKDEVREN